MILKIRTRRVGMVVTATVAAALALSGCSGAAGGNNAKTVLTLATVNNPQMEQMQSLVKDFEKSHPNITVKFKQMQENNLRTAITTDVATGAGQYDIVTVGSQEISSYAKNKWLTPLDSYINKDPGYDVKDILSSVRGGVTADGNMWATPFYGESSVLMYNKSMVQAAGITIPEHPTWDEIAAAAAKLNTSSVAGICMRGMPGWGEFGATLTSMLYTFGSGWYDKDWNAQLNTPQFAKAVNFYMDLVKNSGEKDPASFGYNECLNAFSKGKAAMWVDSTAAAGPLEDKSTSSVVGNVGFAYSPVESTETSGWLYSWNLGIESASKHKDAAWQFVSWATSKQYVKLVGQELGWSQVPPGTRVSTYTNPSYLKAASAFASVTKDSLQTVKADAFSTLPQPYLGYYPTAPSWPSVGDQLTQDLAGVFAGKTTVADVLAKDQAAAQTAGKTGK